MATVLYITAHPLSQTQENESNCLSVGRAFITEYQATHPNDEVIELNLYQMDVPSIDQDVFMGWKKARKGQKVELTEDERKKLARHTELVDQFIGADKYVIVNPMWNKLFPPILKQYIDTLCVARKTFTYTEDGPIGLLGDKKLFHIQSQGGIYSSGPLADEEMGHRYITLVCEFLGITDVGVLFIEGQDQYPDRADTIRREAIERAKQAAKVF
ncbi:FMN-dependent NADH-azoreductase [Alicyclobacillus acidoterrestris]|uniref:FMN dependent NADH:quinone oxidoreductase n=1 Tax=Alicyclobacillus acidoterrestris (strain ATCC 49025 / DSM 3922 / CIP 106132 / NCIMB 13137 / GD3B) TaxID=1356854 RepID=T0D615_ALIAG|nr:FMN-dependent NADH-azoreductase [Alicyclobacillus acidoterrestris]EPZ45186.1 hypothetical protein N007_09290 [Alicyclobacillus acidoterrestris ATCC 49025]UNO49921.1 FMN-dependent NADH-azoreductase [Alicyclobacillus acidoterrestris]